MDKENLVPVSMEKLEELIEAKAKLNIITDVYRNLDSYKKCGELTVLILGKEESNE